MASTLAIGALLKMRTIGRKEGALLLRLGDELIGFGALHECLAGAIADTLPVTVGVRKGRRGWGVRFYRVSVLKGPWLRRDQPRQ